MVLQRIATGSHRKQMLHPFGRVVHLENFRERGYWQSIVYLEVENGLRSRAWSKLKKRLGPEASTLESLKRKKQLTNVLLVDKFHSLWNR